MDFTQFSSLFLVLARLTAFMAAAPFFAIRNVPALVKVGLAALLTMLVGPVLPAPDEPIPGELLAYMLVVMGEVLVGLALGFLATLIFSAIRLAGELVDLQIGFAMTNLFDPQSGGLISALGQFMYTMGILLFLLMDGHHSLLAAIVRSFTVVPLGGAMAVDGVAAHAVKVFGAMFVLGLKIAAPILAVLVISDLALGMVARTVPQLNVFILGFPLKAALGMIALSVTAPVLAVIMASVFGQMERDLLILMGNAR